MRRLSRHRRRSRKADNFVEPSVGCEACHGKGSWHAALAQDSRFRETPDHRQPSQAHLWRGCADLRLLSQPGQIDQSTRMPSGRWVMNPAKLWNLISNPFHPPPEILRILTPTSFPKAHHQQYIDWKQSKHFMRRCDLRFLPLRAPDRGAADPDPDPGGRLQAVFRVPCPSKPEHGSLHPLLCQLRGLSHAADRNQRRVRRPSQPCVYRSAAIGNDRRTRRCPTPARPATNTRMRI